MSVHEIHGNIYKHAKFCKSKYHIMTPQHIHSLTEVLSGTLALTDYRREYQGLKFGPSKNINVHGEWYMRYTVNVLFVNKC